MIEFANGSGIRLVFVRIKVESGMGDDPELGKYLDDLKNYLDERDAFLLDFGDDPRLTSDLFRDAIHFNEEGRQLFTRLLATGMMELFEEK
jgi:lysophospholipase L1-like esterase